MHGSELEARSGDIPVDYNKLEEAALCTPNQHRQIAEARARVGWLAMQLGGATLTEVAKRLKRDVTSLSSAARRLGERAPNSQELQECMERLQSQWKS
jgi:REP-associated tyrosine transposase